MIAIKVTLYHATNLKNINSILDKGLIPGFYTSPSQDWTAKYSGKGIYFYSRFPEVVLCQYQDYVPGREDSIMIVVKVVVDVSPEDLIPEEEEIGWDATPTIDEGIDTYLKGGSVVVLKRINIDNITEIFYPDRPFINDYIAAKCKSPLLTAWSE